MPELPEVETVRRGLSAAIVGRRVAMVEARRADLRFPLPNHFGDRIAGATIQTLFRRAKYLVMGLSNGEALIMHLGMTGRFTIFSDTGSDTPGAYIYENSGDQRHDHVVLHLDDGVRVVYNDPRRFGFMMLMPEAERADHALFRDLGAEPLGPEWTPHYVARRGVGKRINLKAFLMDQRIVAGLGNIYVSEALHRARLSPNRSAASLADRKGGPTARAQRLAPAVREVLELAIAAGGSTLRDYRHADGASGQFQNAFTCMAAKGSRAHARNVMALSGRSFIRGAQRISAAVVRPSSILKN